MRKSKKEIKEISLEIRRLRKLVKDKRAEKLLLPSGDNKRIVLHREMQELKILLAEQKQLKKQKQVNIIVDPDKEKLISEILRLEPGFPKDLVDLNKFTEAELQNHINRVRIKRGLDK